MSDLAVTQGKCPVDWERRTQGVELARLARGLGNLTDSVQVEWPDNLWQRNRYDDLAEFLFRPVADRCQEQFGDSRMENAGLDGALVVGRVLGYAPSAYSRFCAKQKQPRDLAELGDILRRSSQTPDSLAKMNRYVNEVYEKRLGIRDFLLNYVSGGGFAVTLHDDGLAYYEAEPALLASIDSDVEQKRQSGKLPPQQPDEICPARPIIRKMWEAGIDICLTDPNLFAADLAA
ncbi:MAG TPA: hypothetical protein VLG37_01250 [Candidatus Saccharimonadales bacterium]|nr:hypothetical protein [Candidatus Saccharimonadales bacterium]